MVLVLRIYVDTSICYTFLYMKLTNQQRQQLESIGKKYDLKLILLYGSFASGLIYNNSDIDIAYMEQKDLTLDKTLELDSELADVFVNENRDCDINSLRRKDSLFLYEVSKNSQLLYGSDYDYAEFCAYAFRLYVDTEDLRKLEDHLIHKYQHHLNNKYGIK